MSSKEKKELVVMSGIDSYEFEQTYGILGNKQVKIGHVKKYPRTYEWNKSLYQIANEQNPKNKLITVILHCDFRKKNNLFLIVYYLDKNDNIILLNEDNPVKIPACEDDILWYPTVAISPKNACTILGCE